MADRVVSFYDSMADYYHLIFEDWDRSIHRQARILGSVISQEISGQHLRILDCACGIGTQSLGLAALGHHVVGSDLSPAEVARAKREARNRGLEIQFYVSDMTDLKEINESRFDVIAAFDNALPHLTSEQLTRAIGAMAARLRPGGLSPRASGTMTCSSSKDQPCRSPPFSVVEEAEELSTKSGTGPKKQNTLCTSTSRSKPKTSGAHTTSSPSTGA
jgi:SAM-dependent methyltransferase